MSLSQEQMERIAIAGRISSGLSILGVFTIIGTFCLSRYCRSPIHRIIFYNSFYNLIDSIATIISINGPQAGDTSSLCQFQGFALQMFPLADVLWTLAMALDTYLVVFYHFDAHTLHKLETKYIAAITTLTFIPAFIFLFINTPERGSIYGSQTIWCSISQSWMLIRVTLYYIPVWIIIVIVMIIYCLIGTEISRLRNDFKLTDDEQIALTSTSNSQPFDNSPNTTTTTTIGSNPANQTVRITEAHVTSEFSVQRISAPQSQPPPSSHSTSINDHPKQRRVSFRQYILMPSLFFLALLATWVAPTINRVSSLIRPDYEPYSLLLAVSALGSLRGFWNGVIFITMSMNWWKRHASERKASQKVRTLSQGLIRG